MFCLKFEKLLNFKVYLLQKILTIKIAILQACISVNRYLYFRKIACV